METYSDVYYIERYHCVKRTTDKERHLLIKA